MNLRTSHPVIVVSPAVRAGTTLVQRLLCSAPNALVYGDTVGQEMEFLANYATVKEQMLGLQQPLNAPLRSAVLAGDVSDFITPLAPTLRTHADGLKNAACAWLDGCAAEAEAAGRPIWGWKMAGADARALAKLVEWFPAARWIWISRNLADCFRSAKAAGLLQGAEDATRFVQSAAAARAAFAAVADRALALDYAAMTEEPAATVRLLETHTGAAGIDAGVFARRVNQAGSAVCVPPAALTAQEEAVLLTDSQTTNPSLVAA